MKIEIKQLNVTLQNQQPSGLLAALTIAGAATGNISTQSNAPAIGEKWPGTEATYGGVSVSLDGDRLVHLLLWNSDTDKDMEYDAAVKHAEAVNPEMASHLPTRHQSITLFENLQDQFNQDCYYWTLTKTKSGKAAFGQHFYYGSQSYSYLSAELRARAVSEIPL